MRVNRREWLGRIAAGSAGALLPFARARAEPVQARTPSTAPAPPPAAAPTPSPGAGELALKDFQPRSMLHVEEHKVLRSRFPAIDVHAHMSWSGGLKGTDTIEYLAAPPDLLPVMDRKNLQMMINLTGGTGPALESSIKRFDQAAPGRFLTFTEPMWARTNEPGYAQKQADEIEKAKRAGAHGLKVLKTLGLFLRENVTSGPLVKVDDPRFDPMWDACGRVGLPVSIHVSDPEAFFTPIDRFNERYDELGHHPDWSFYDRDFPSNAEILAARDRVLARHPRTQFILLHVAHNAENLAFVSETLDHFPNTVVDIAARIGELGRQPRTARKFFDKYQDRILFGTDAVPPPDGENYPQQVFKDELYEIYFRFLETEDEYFDYAPAPVPPQGRWRIYGLGLPEPILKKVYHDNAARILKLTS
ncbi:MAG: amidohydrolase [Acidobacteria bacterium]|nr:MAG: amidohydrolase [Acidobacteriota bacterium]